jgi:hypothetical protein
MRTSEARYRIDGPRERIQAGFMGSDPKTDEDADELWLAEAERRLKDYDSGKTKARNADDALEELEQKLKK